MVRNLSKIIILATILIPTLHSCSFLKEVTAFGKCEFRTTTLEDPELAGVDVSRIQSFGDIGITDMAAITTAIMRGYLPLSFTLNLEARNPNPATAAMNRLEYLAFIDDVQVASGSLNDRIEIPANGGVTTIPLQLQTDLIEVLSKDSRQALVNFGLNLADAGNRPTRVSIKVKPTILIGGIELVYPGYFTVKYDFTSGD
jgi:LEA14-like dessication related protein